MKNKKLILKTQQRFTSKRHNVYTKEINKIALSSNDGSRMQSIDSIETCIWDEERSSMQQRRYQCNIVTKQHKTFNFDYVTKEDIKEHNPNWPETYDHSY